MHSSHLDSERPAASELPSSLQHRPSTGTLVPPAPHARSTRWVAGSVASLLVAATAIGVALRWGHEAAPADTAIRPDIPRAEGSTILFSKSFRERAGIRTVEARKAPLTPMIQVVGAVTFDPEHVAAVGARIRGFVRKLSRIEGDTVKVGDVLAEIESAELGEAQASVGMVHAQKKAAELNSAREHDLVARRLSTLREAEVAQASLDEYRAMLGAAQQKVTALGGSATSPFGVYILRAPLGGTVVERHVTAGQSVEGNLIAFRVADLDHLWVELAVFERNLDAIRKGDVVELRPPAVASAAIAGVVAYVGDEIDQTTRSAPVRIKVDNKRRLLRPGQSVTAKILTSGPARESLLVPTSAITFVDGKPTVFVSTGEDRVVPTAVELGATNGEAQELLGGIAEGTVVVSEGVFALKSELFR